MCTIVPDNMEIGGENQFQTNFNTKILDFERMFIKHGGPENVDSFSELRASNLKDKPNL